VNNLPKIAVWQRNGTFDSEVASHHLNHCITVPHAVKCCMVINLNRPNSVMTSTLICLQCFDAVGNNPECP